MPDQRGSAFLLADHLHDIETEGDGVLQFLKIADRRPAQHMTLASVHRCQRAAERLGFTCFNFNEDQDLTLPGNQVELVSCRDTESSTQDPVSLLLEIPLRLLLSP